MKIGQKRQNKENKEREREERRKEGSKRDWTKPWPIL